MDACAVGREDIASAGKILVAGAACLCGGGDPDAKLACIAAQILHAFALPPEIAGLPVTCRLFAIEARGSRLEDDARSVLGMFGKQRRILDVGADRHAECAFRTSEDAGHMVR